MRRRLLAFGSLCALLLPSCATSDSAEHASRATWVFFRHDPASRGSAAVSAYTIEQRQRRGIGTFDNDAAIPDSLIRQIEAQGAVVRQRSRWLHAVSIEATPSVLRRIERMRSVAWTRSVGELEKAGVTGNASAVLQAAPPVTHAFDSAFYGVNYTAMKQLNVPAIHATGYDGTGVRIAIFDTGFQPQHEALSSRIIFAQRDFINNDANVQNQPGDPTDEDQERHGTQVLSLIGAFLPGLMVSPAYGSQFLLAKVDAEPGDTKLDEDRWVAAMEWADSLGATIVNSSVDLRYRYTDRPELPYDSLNGDLFIMTRTADEAARRGILVIQAMGDAPIDDFKTLAAPADADSVISVGSIDRSGAPASFGPGFTGRGPTADGRVKPELVALGTGLLGASSTTRVGFDLGLSGTSYSTALITGGAALFMQAWPNLPPMAVRRALQLAGNTATHPDNSVGWGVPDVAGAILFPEGIALNPLDPMDITGAVTSIAPTFSWSTPLTDPRMHPVTYEVQVATDTGFHNIVYSDTMREALVLAPQSALPASPRLFWRVVARTTTGIVRASLRAPFRVPDWVRLLTFAGSEPTFANTTQPELEWVPLDPRGAGPFTYEVQVLANGTGAVVQTLKNLTVTKVRVAEALTPNQSFRWRVIARARTGQVDTVSSTQPFVISTDDKPPATVLYQNFPNPFPNSEFGDGKTSFWFDLANDGIVELTIYEPRGQAVRHLIPLPGCAPITFGAGIYGRTGQVLNNAQCIELQWDGRGDDGRLMPAGPYIVRLSVSGKTFTKNMLFRPGKR
jgi:hypothetical protein